jgi:hypothetical protein
MSLTADDLACLSLSYERTALECTRHSTGQIGSHNDSDVIVIQRHTQIELFTYGFEEQLPPTAGFEFTPFCAGNEMTNCGRGGRLTERDEHGFAIVGLAARIGRPKVYDPLGGADMYPPWLDRHQMTLREALLESASISLRYKEMYSEYSLGSVVQRPLMGGVWGPAVELPRSIRARTSERGRIGRGRLASPAKAHPPDPAEIDKSFVPFQSVAMSDVPSTRHATVMITTGSKDIRLGVEGVGRGGAGSIVVPIRVWLFGRTRAAGTSPRSMTRPTTRRV